MLEKIDVKKINFFVLNSCWIKKTCRACVRVVSCRDQDDFRVMSFLLRTGHDTKHAGHGT